jgi:DNA-binding NarL/FixJ family response regulator
MSLTRRAADASSVIEESDGVLLPLTPRERQVALAVADGASNQELAADCR